MTQVFTTSSAAKLLGISPKRLKRWLDYGYYEPDYVAAAGKSEYRLFSERDIEILREILNRIDDGCPLGKAFREEDNQ